MIRVVNFADTTVFNAELFQIPDSSYERIIIRFIKTNTVVTAQQAKVRKRGQVILSFISNDTGIIGNKVRVVQRDFDNLYLAQRIGDREEDDAFFLRNVFSDSYQQPGFIFKYKDTWIEQADDL
ncbi:hypothetical protein D3C86_1615110 [compost metagenome]